MPSSQKAQHFLIKGLDSNIDSIDANLSQRFKEGLIEVSGVGLDGYFCIRDKMEAFPYPHQDFFELFGAEKRGGSAADVDRVKRIESVTIHLHLSEESI